MNIKLRHIIPPVLSIIMTTTAVVACPQTTTEVYDNEYVESAAEIHEISAESIYRESPVVKYPIIKAEETVVEKSYYDIPLSSELQDKVKYWKSYMNIDLDDSYIYAMIYQESRFNPEALGSSGDSGYCQILQKYFNEIYSNLESDYPELAEQVDYDIFNEETNLLCGLYWLDYSAQQTTGEKLSTTNISAALTAYNRGVKGAKNYFDKNNTYSTSYSKSIISVAHYIQEHNTVPQE